jgi:predicted nucleic acid-binding protein
LNAYPDTSFLFAFYVQQSNSPTAAAYAATMREPLFLTSLLKFEFCQALRFQAWRHAMNPNSGIQAQHVLIALNQPELDLASGQAELLVCPLENVLRRAEDLSKQHTLTAGYRGFDILHVATALELQASGFLTFDANQRKLAGAEGLQVKP